MTERLRPRQTRVKTGCLVCRLRRKKCDERKPICTGCQRNCLICSWAAGTSGSNVSAEPGWRSRLESGQRVGQAATDLLPTERETIPAPYQNKPRSSSRQEVVLGTGPSLSLGPRFTESFSTAFLRDPTSRILFEHYVSKTSHLLSSIRGPDNPFIRCVLPFAQADSMVMDSVLALSGAHLCCTSSNPAIQSASTTRYALVLRQFKHTLTKLTLGNILKPVNLLLTALMLCQVESIGGNPHGAVFHHLRASSSFVHLILADPTQTDHDLIGFLLELYAYLVSIVNITSNTNSDYETVIFDPYISSLQQFQDSRTYGSMLGCAQDLFSLIPSICKFGYQRLQEEAEGPYSFESIALYKSLETKINNWQVPRNIINSDIITAAKIYRASLLLFLHASFYGSSIHSPELNTLIDASFLQILPSAMELPPDAPIATTLLWPCMIIGSCLKGPSAATDYLRDRMLNSPFNMLLVRRAVQILDWVWEDESLFGPWGLGEVMKRHGISHCMS